MAHQVFVSYAKEDADAGSRIGQMLEADGVGCWLAVRDLEQGLDPAAATLAAIRTSDLVLLIFSAWANASSTVLRDIERAIAYEKPVLSLHLDSATPNPSLEYYLNLWQWLDASGALEDKRADIVAAVRAQLAAGSGSGKWRRLDAPAGVDSKEEEIVAAVQAHLAQIPSQAKAQEPGATAPSDSAKRPGILARAWTAIARRPSRRTWAIALGATIAVLALGLGLGLGLPGTAAHQGTWTRLQPVGTLPPARDGNSVAYDPSGGQVIVFGGGGAGGLNDTWAYDPAANTWTELKPSGMVPPGRLDHVIAYEPITRRLILFGGFDRNNTQVNGKWVTPAPTAETWAYDPAANAWAKLEPSGTPPPARYAATMAYDPTTGRLVMFGGCANLDSGPLLNDTWAYDPAANTWAELKPAGPLPAPRGAPEMVYDLSTKRLIMFGGNGSESDLNDTWAYDPAANNWTELKPSGPVPPIRCWQALVSDPSTGRIILFGGHANDGNKSFNDTWAYDPTANTWTELKPSGTVPGARWALRLVYVPSTGQAVMFGGVSAAGDALNDTWAFTP